MNCEQYEASIIACAAGELDENEAAECRAHIGSCDSCRAIYESYVCVIESVAGEPAPVPTRAESAALSRALARVETASPREPLAEGLPAMIWASLLAFAVVACVLGLHVAGCFSLVAAARAIGPAPIAVAVVMTVFITSFVPIAVASRRRPLNGATFRR